MRLTHEFTVPASLDEAWKVLLDIERIGPCMPGATITRVDGDSFEGSVKVKVGPMQVVYRGEASFTEKNEMERRVVMRAAGKESRGTGSADAVITAQLSEHDSRTLVTVDTDLDITGKPAQLGRGLIEEVGQKLIARFAVELALEITGEAAPANSETPALAGTVSRDDDALDLLGVGAWPLVRRVGPPVLIGVVLVAVAVRSIRRLST